MEKTVRILKHWGHPYIDEFIIACACDILREKQPDVLLIHPANIDGARHQYGVFHEISAMNETVYNHLFRDTPWRVSVRLTKTDRRGNLGVFANDFKLQFGRTD